MTAPLCVALKTSGEPCGQTLGLDDAGLCATHRPGGLERMKAAASRGGRATKAKHAGGAFHIDDLPPMETLEDAQKCLDTIRIAVLTRRISHNEGNAAAKIVDSWVKAQQALTTDRLVGELEDELKAKTLEIERLRQQLTARGARPAMVS